MRVHLVSLYVSLNKVFFIGTGGGLVRGDMWSSWQRHKLPLDPISAINTFHSTLIVWKPLKLTPFRVGLVSS